MPKIKCCKNFCRRFYMLFLVFMGSFLLIQNPSQAGEVEKPWHMSMYAGGVFPDDDTIDDNVTVGGRITYEFLENIEAGIDISWQQYEDKFWNTKLGDVTHIPVYAIVKYNIILNPESKTILPYLLGGVGFSYWHYDEALSSISADDDISFTGKVGAGLDISLGDKASLFLEGGYSWAEYDIRGTISGSFMPIVVSGSTELNLAFAVLGLRISL
ncbi:MAG: outer membrane beta-barrel protein [Candidatus Omnitrophota bacterium]